MFKKCVFLFSLLCISAQASLFDWFSSSDATKPKNAEALLSDFDDRIKKALEEYRVPGLAVGVIANGKLVYAKGFGYRDVEKKLPTTPETLFAIGSCTKAFTSFVLGTLIDEGLMQWNQPVIDVLRDFRLWDPHATRNLTLRDLLTHRSGMPRHDFMWYNASMSRAEVMDRLRYLEPSCDIRERYQYNNLMYLTAGYAMEQVTGKTWEELVTERVLEPLGMKETNFSVEEMQGRPDFASPYIEKGHVLKKMPFRNISTVGPAGSINSNVTDLSHWIQLHLNGGALHNKYLISPATLQEMHSPQVIVSGPPDTKEIILSAYGIGWHISSYRGQYMVSHDGGVDGFTSLVTFVPHSGVGIVVLANKNLTPLPRYLSFQFFDRLLNLSHIDWLKEGLESMQKSQETVQKDKLQQDLLRKKGTFPCHPIDHYAGEYSHPGYGKILVEHKDDKLHATFNGITSFLDHWHYNVFIVAEESEDLILSREGMKFTFVDNIDGDVEELRIPFEASASDIVFKKIVHDALLAKEYLHRFVGFYEAYGYTVEVSMQPQGLCAILPGQPIYELIPVAENEFAVKSLTNYAVRFIVDEMGKVKEVLLIPPYGLSITAKPKTFHDVT